MRMKWVYIFTITIIVSASLLRGEHVPRGQKTEFEILDALLEPNRYDPRIRPAGTNMRDSAVIVNVSLYVIDIQQEDPYLKEYKLQCYLRQKWFDNRLVFHGSNGNVKLRDISRIWTPDLLILNEVSAYTHNTISPNTLVSISQNGHVFTSNRLTLVLKCRTDLKFYPHDQQVCKISIESFGSYASEILLHWDTHPHSSGYSANISHDQYDLLDFETYESTEYSQKVLYDVLHADLLFSRNFSPFFWNLYLPCIVIVIVSWGSFCIPPEKIILRLAFLVVLLILMLHFSPNLYDFRNTRYHVTALEFWVLGCLSFLVSTFLEYLYVHRLFSKEDEDDKPPVREDVELENGMPTITEKLQNTLKLFKNSTVLKNRLKFWATDASKVDTLSRNVLFPVGFVIFNILYWSICLSGRCSSIDEWSS